MKSTTELLQPRYKVALLYPECDFKLGQIIVLPIWRKSEQGDQYWTDWMPLKNGGDRMMPQEYFSAFPAIFQPLQWWEERDIKDMPTYLKTANERNPGVYKVLRWDMANMIGFTDTVLRQGCALCLYKPEYAYYPATNEEYEAYKSINNE